jgi:spermidine synthase
MIEPELLGTAQVPDGVELRLMRRGADFMITLAGNELMTTRMHHSEDSLAVMTHERLGERGPQRWLIGGYGMGFTLRAALNVLGQDSAITVVELVPEIIKWARGPMAEVAAGCLDDPRVMLVEDDVSNAIRAAHGIYDAILLDVDNGPDGLVREGNNGLYTGRGLRAAKHALSPGGMLAIWSAHQDNAFVKRLKDTGFEVEERFVRARPNNKGPRHFIWFCRKPGEAED